MQLAVPKFVKLTLQPASSTAISRASPATQVIGLDNSQQGVKPVALRIKVLYTLAGTGERVEEMCDYKGPFPPGF